MSQPNAEVLYSARLVARRREVRRARVARIRRTAIVVTAAVSLAYGGWAIAHSRLFALDRIRITGAQHLARERVMTAGGIRVGMNVLSLNPETIRDRLLTIPIVEDASVRRIYPSGLSIAITERRPVAVLALPESEWLFDARGIAIGETAAAVAGLPVIRIDRDARVVAGRPLPDIGASSALSVWQAVPASLRTKLSSIDMDPAGSITLMLGRTTIIFGPATELGAKFAAVAQIFAQPNGASVSRIDVSAPSRPAARYA